MAFENASCNLEFRKYQKGILTVFEALREKKDRKFHIVAPPGSGKTIIGLELMRRLKENAVVFSPNQAIQSGWLKQLGAEKGAGLFCYKCGGRGLEHPELCGVYI